MKRPCTLVLIGWMMFATDVAADDDPPSAVGSVMQLLESGRVPESRLEAVLEIVAERGNAHDLEYLYRQALAPDVYPAELRVTVLRNLAEAARTRKVVPAGDLSGVAELLASENAELRDAAVTLVGLWKVEAAAEPLQRLVVDESTSDAVRRGALAALVTLGPDAARPVVEALAAEDRSFSERALGVATMARFDLERAAEIAADVLREAGDEEDPARIVDAFLNRRGGPEALAAALRKNPPSTDTAKLALRHMYAVGRSDAELSRVLGDIAGIDADPEPPTAEELAALITEVESEGDPAAGEQVFRRADLSCMKCHAVNKAGGQIGPDLSALGSSSPLDYIVKSIYDPDAQIKEAFHTRVVLTADGDVLQGIVVDDTEDELVLRNADGELLRIPRADIEVQREGKSLMPKGLVKFMTHDEIVDLVAFLSQLGKPGEYAVRETPRMQRWRVLTNVPEPLQEEAPGVAAFEQMVLQSGEWGPAYSRVNGVLPLEELAAAIDSPRLYVQGEVDVTAAGLIGVSISAPPGTQVWVDDEPFGTQHEFTTHLSEGRHKITLLIDATQTLAGGLLLELRRLPDSEAEFTVVDGA